VAVPPTPITFGVKPLVSVGAVAAEAVAASGDMNAASATAPAASPIARRVVMDVNAIPFLVCSPVDYELGNAVAMNVFAPLARASGVKPSSLSIVASTEYGS
jgi:hypothetical protein